MTHRSEDIEVSEPVGSDLRGRVLRAATELFHRNGYYITSLREVAAKAGTSESGVLRVFGNKYELLMGVYNEAWRVVNHAIETRIAKSLRDPRGKLIAILKIVWSLYEEEPVHMAFVIMNTGNTDTLILTRKATAIISEENQRYVSLIDSLTTEVSSKRLVRGVSAAALREGVLGLTEGILLGWYLADNTPAQYPKKISLREAEELLRRLLFNQ